LRNSARAEGAGRVTDSWRELRQVSGEKAEERSSQHDREKGAEGSNGEKNEPGEA
jgi:hypothetical protein